MAFSVNDDIESPAVSVIDFPSILAIGFVIYASSHVDGAGVEPAATINQGLGRPTSASQQTGVDTGTRKAHRSTLFFPCPVQKRPRLSHDGG